MEFIIAETFFPATRSFSAIEKARVLDFVEAFQRNPANPGISLERITRTKVKNLWSGRVSQDIRAVLYKDGETWAALYVAHHDDAYEWAERREVGRHPVTGALQVVETVQSVVEQITVIEVEPEASPTFEKHGNDYLLSLGVPETWLPTIRLIKTDEQLLAVIEKLPEDVGERLLDVADGKLVTPPAPIAPTQPPHAHADAARSFLRVDPSLDLQQLLAQPMAKWLAFLHPSQQRLVDKTYNGPVKVTGSAGTGKTVVAMHRARRLARDGHRVLLTTYVTTLAKNIQRALEMFCTPEELELITVSTVHSRALAVVRTVEPKAKPANDDDIDRELKKLAARHAPGFDLEFVRAEWRQVVQVQAIGSWDDYRSARRVGRGKALSVKDRKALWKVFESVMDVLSGRSRYDWPSLCRRATELIAEGTIESEYDAVIVDEVQDLLPGDLLFLRELIGSRLEHLMLVGDAGQRIYPGGFSLGSLGIDVRGRSRVLRINYRTTEQIRRRADELLGSEADDLTGGTESRTGTRSLLRGPDPKFASYADDKSEEAAMAEKISSWLKSGVEPEEVGVFARDGKRAAQLVAALRRAGVSAARLAKQDDVEAGVQVGTMHRAKGLEFKRVWVASCSSALLPSAAALRGLDASSIDDITARERRLLYVSMTRARDRLVVSWFGEPSPFLEPFVQEAS